jgi:hypothetical protein
MPGLRPGGPARGQQIRQHPRPPEPGLVISSQERQLEHAAHYRRPVQADSTSADLRSGGGADLAVFV